jgi:photosystem II stability/assembly factor-like uncharacterized protein
MIACLSPNGPIAARSAAAPTILAVATAGGLVLLRRDAPGRLWRVASRALEAHHLSSLLFESTRGGLFAGAHSGGLYFSGDSGATWEPRSRGISIPHVFSLAGAPTAEGIVLYAGTEPVSLFVSHDYGRSWLELPSIHERPGMDKWTFPAPPHAAHTKCLTIDRRDPNVIFAAIEQGALLKTEDGGRSWRELDSYWRPDDFWYRDIHRVVPLAGDPDTLYMPTGMGLYRSHDAGLTWEQLTDRAFRIGYPDHLVVSPDDDRVLIMSGAGTDPSIWRRTKAAGGTVMRSDDGGRSWRTADRGLPAEGKVNYEAMSLAAWPGGYALFLGSTDGEVYCSEDGAESWTCIARGLAPVSKGRHYANLLVSAGK